VLGFLVEVVLGVLLLESVQERFMEVVAVRYLFKIQNPQYLNLKRNILN
jgi:hypothetical protein